jgi:hypothetical protein
VAIGFAADDAAEPEATYLDTLGWFLTAMFATEFATRFAACYDRPAYLRGHWIDLVALIPVACEVRVLRLVRREQVAARLRIEVWESSLRSRIGTRSRRASLPSSTSGHQRERSSGVP